jgi:YidC/Oxa1 family membrane protein insertase
VTIAGISSVLQPIENVIFWGLKQLGPDHLGLPWAWAVVGITIAVRLLLVPVTVRQIHSMQSMQRHMPEMKAIQERYKDDRQKKQEELMRFYRENKINPAASCLPMLIQIPIFISLYYVLKHFDQRVYSIYHGSKDWLHLVDITQPVMTGWGPLLLTIYVVSQLSSSYFMSTTMQGAQRILLMVMQLFFVVFIVANPKSFPAGLMIYWVTTNLWTTGQGLVTRRLMPKPAPPEKRSSRSPAKDEPVVASGNGAGTTPRKAAPAPTRKPVAGPPRRVKRKKGGGGAKR